jgi:hypothetical protein
MVVKFILHTLIHTLPFEILPLYIVLDLSDQLLTIPAIYVKFWMPPKTYHKQIISRLFKKFTYWQEMFSPYLESVTPAFCAEAPEVESVN